MQINPTNSHQNNVNFKSVMPVKVFIDGNPTTDSKAISEAVNALMKILKKTETDDAKKLTIQFNSQVDDLCTFTETERNFGHTLRYVDDVDGTKGDYLITGLQAEDIQKAALEIGQAKKLSIQKWGTDRNGKAIKTEQVLKALRTYFAKIRGYIDDHAYRLKSREKGKPLSLILSCRRELVLNKKPKRNGKPRDINATEEVMMVKNLYFEPISQTQPAMAARANKPKQLTMDL